MPRTPEAAALARGLIRTALMTWRLNTLTDQGELVISELVTNAVLHTRCSCIRVSIDRPSYDVVRIEVVDKSHRLPAIRPAGENDDNGRGLALVDAFTTKWGTDMRSWGKLVWAEMKAEPDHEHHDAA
ncbi:ATP-binding protein [Streptomyces sp. TR02-1]|uniref:ATP-binding protein n=1 Tax=Streptomyces sp. TR02-1 TaxID=3385977 RepID=UPI0039A05CB7